ncbi:MAG TPA: MFS transporter [Candidatus Acidoferrales bacterium]|nr:MFS transporter [Candidatus Acidoferrales bacterium]
MKHKLRITLAGAIGNLLEWYDFGLYGLLAPVLAPQFFPDRDHLASLLGVYGGFAAGFAMRPLGAIVLGHLGDRVGRRFVLALSVLLMGVSTVAVGLLPTYHAVGVWAPVLLIAVRLFQGFSVGGEFVDSVTYLVEAAPQNRRGLVGSVANLGSTAGMLLAAGVAAAVTTLADSATLTGWAWRTPFLLGGVIASAAYILRRHLPETENSPSEKAAAKPETPLRRAIREQPRLMLAALLFTSGYGIADYLTMVLLPTYAHEFGGVAEHLALRINTVGQALALLVVPLSGWLSDCVWSRRAALIAAFAAEAVLSWQAFRLTASLGAAGLWLAQLSFAFLLAVVMGVGPAMLAEQFPAGYRVSAHAVSFNIGIGIAGGTAPMIATALIKVTGSPMAPAAYLIFAAILALIGVFMLRDRSRQGMNEADQ